MGQTKQTIFKHGPLSEISSHFHVNIIERATRHGTDD